MTASYSWQMNNSPSFQIQICNSFSEIDAKQWDALLPAGKDARPNPFVTYGFLSALEDSGSATAQTGWLGQHLLLLDEQDNLIAALPNYLKNHSQGEYVFDFGWAEGFERAGGKYYPKLQSAIPFTPASGPRFLTHAKKGDSRVLQINVLAQGLKQLVERHSLSSAHITFMNEDERVPLEQQEFLHRTDQQFHWENRGYGSFDDFLETLSSRKRKNIRKERRQAQNVEDIEIEWLSGAQITETHWDHFFEFYQDTGSRKWGHPYLTREFYSLIGERLGQSIVLMMAKRHGRYIAGAINFVGDDCLFGRHWGCVEQHPALHFEVCYYQAIEYAIENKLARVEAGAQGEHKLARGYTPKITHSMHYISHPGFRDAVRNHLARERDQVAMMADALERHSPYKLTDQQPPLPE